ncbi:MAG TPA: hypothetical protein PKZ35_11625 [Gammaproteobacteria bacterium]|nr:hypothetical protein [Gammaproteobacteria bacterium]
MFGKIALFFVALSAATLANADEISLEPCTNGGVSSSGRFPSELMEQRFYTQLNWRSFAPYYLFAVSASYLESPFVDVDPPRATPR